MEGTVSQHNKRIAKNTLMLYFRMILVMGVSLYTVRVVLNILGIVDYGIYNVVGGIVTLFSFLSNTMSSASQRFFSYELGRGNTIKLKETFSMTIQIYFLLGIIIVFLAETVGLWFLNTQMDIPSERMEAARWVYQFSIISFVITILVIPYNAMIISKENMNIFAYISIAEALLKLGVAFSLGLFHFDKLKMYAVLFFISTLIISFTYKAICQKKYKETHYSFIQDKQLFKQLISYSGWNLFGALSGVLNTQGINIVLNIFFGPVINAAMAIANQVGNTIRSFSLNFYTAVNPQIIKSYAVKDKNRLYDLVFYSSKFAYLLLLMLSLPIILETELILSVWLGKVDQNMILFTRLILINILVNILESPLTQAARSTGDIKKYQIYVGVLTLLILPISYLFLKLGFPPQIAIYIMIGIFFITIFVRLGVLKSLLQFPIIQYLKEVLLKLFILSIIIMVIPIFIHFQLKTGYARLLLVLLSSISSVIIVTYFWGINTEQRFLFKSYISNRFLIKIKK